MLNVDTELLILEDLLNTNQNVYPHLAKLAAEYNVPEASQQYINFIFTFLSKVNNADLEIKLAAQACKENNLLLLEGCLNKNSQLVHHFYEENELPGTTLTWYAVIETNSKLLDILLKNGGKINGIQYGKTTLYTACESIQYGNANITELVELITLLVNDYTEHAHDKYHQKLSLAEFINYRARASGLLPGMTALELACRLGALPIIKVLLNVADLSTLKTPLADPEKRPDFLKSLVKKFTEKVLAHTSSPEKSAEIAEYYTIINTLLLNMDKESIAQQKIKLDVTLYQNFEPHYLQLLKEIDTLSTEQEKGKEKEKRPTLADNFYNLPPARAQSPLPEKEESLTKEDVYELLADSFTNAEEIIENLEAGNQDAIDGLKLMLEDTEISYLLPEIDNLFASNANTSSSSTIPAPKAKQNNAEHSPSEKDILLQQLSALNQDDPTFDVNLFAKLSITEIKDILGIPTPQNSKLLAYSN